MTSRVSTDKVAVARRRLECPFNDRDNRVDCALATNMISVGLDFPRLGLMLVLSAASVWEIVIKHAIGKPPLPEPPAIYVPERMRVSRVRELPITHAHALAIGADGNRSIAHERDQPTVVRKLVRGRVVRDHGRIRSLADL